MRPDEREFVGFVRAVSEVGVHVVVAGGAPSVAASALLLTALKRAHVPVSGLSVADATERPDNPALRAFLAGAPAVLVVGATPPPLVDEAPQLAIDAADGEPLPARTLRLCEALTGMPDRAWCAAVGMPATLDGTQPPHELVERALARHPSEELLRVAELLDGAVRGPEPAQLMLATVELLAVTPKPRRFLESDLGHLLLENLGYVHAQLARAARLHPRAGNGVVVVEYASPCAVEELVARRWRGLKPGVAVLVANHGVVDGRVAVCARAALPEALERLRADLGDDERALLAPEAWNALLAHLGVTAQPIEALTPPPLAQTDAGALN